MSKRISELTEFTGNLSGQELVEISVPNNGSPSGYITRSVEVSKFMGSGGELPYRYEISEQTIPLQSDYTFKLRFPKSLFQDTAMLPNTESSITDKLAAGLFKFNALAAFEFQEVAHYTFESFGFLNSEVLVPLGNISNGAHGNSDDTLARIGTFNFGNDGRINTLGQPLYPIDNPLYSTPSIQPIGFFEDWSSDNHTDTADELVFEFLITRPYGVVFNPVNMIIRGYVDVNTVFSPFYIPS